VNSSIRNPNDLTAEWLHAVEYLGATVIPNAELCSGVGGRTLSGPVAAPTGAAAWLRVMSAPRPGGKIWEGPALAEEVFSDDVPRPRLLAEHSWSASQESFNAHLWERLQSHTVSDTPDLISPPGVSDEWWKNLRTAVNAVGCAPLPHGREVMTQSFISRITRFIPTLEGTDLTVGTWRTAHGDLHWANITRDPLQIIDWEGFGAAPAGYDAAVLLAYSLPVPSIAARVREVFETDLRTPDGRLAQLVICAEIIQASERDDIHARLRPYAEALAAELVPQ
jgi:hypothetical protein